jgi:hypothetical protein
MVWRFISPRSAAHGIERTLGLVPMRLNVPGFIRATFAGRESDNHSAPPAHNVHLMRI